MELHELTDDARALPTAWRTLRIDGLTADSRAVRPGFLFAALPGSRVDGARFVPEALAAGASAILAGPRASVPDGVPVLRADDPRRAFAIAAARFHARQPDCVVAVTGTSGKTSVVSFARQIFAAAGKTSASLGTVGVVSPAGESKGELTTPDPVALHATLRRLADEGVTHAALEASSHGLDQHRLDGIRFAAAGFTNIGRDHLDYHPTPEAYLSAKLRLFEELLPSGAAAVFDADRPESGRVREAAASRGLRILDVGRGASAVRLVSATPEGLGQRLVIEAGGPRHEVVLPLLGDFQVSNALVALGLAVAVGIEPAVAVAALAGLEGAKGRLELVGQTRQGARVFIDYAHKPEAIENALSALRPFTAGRLAVVFGAGGDRDRGKRPLMGAAAVRNADLVYVTDDNPRGEDPAAIRAEIMAEATGATEIGDRRQAIETAISRLEAGDVLVVAGKGHETGQIVGDRVLAFSDHEVVAGALAREAVA